MNQKNPSFAIRSHSWIPWALLVFTAALTLFFNLGGRDFENRDTVRYVEIVWEMTRSGDLIVPRFSAVIFTEKPILLVWLIYFCSWLVGGITPFIARLPSALSAFGCVLVTTLIGRRIFNNRTGLLAGFILCTSYAFAWEARVCRTDMLLTFWVTLSLLYLYLGYLRVSTGAASGRGCFIIAYFSAGLAALTKGPVGLAFPAIAFFFYLLCNRRLAVMKRMAIPWGILIILSMQAAWYVPFLIRIGPEGRSYFYEMYIYKENLLRFTTGFDHYEPVWYYLPAIVGRFLPWSPFLLLYPILLYLRRGQDTARDNLFPAVWFLSLLTLLTISSGKHSRYALPLYPAAALMVADFWERLIAMGKSRFSLFVVSLVSIIGLVGAVAYPIAAYHLSPQIWLLSFVASVVLIVMVVSIIRSSTERKLLIAFAVVVFSFGCAWISYNEYLPQYNTERAREQRLAAQLSPAVGSYKLATYGPTQDRFGRRVALGFFMQKPVIFIGQEPDLLDYLQSEERVFCLIESDVYTTIKGKLPHSSQVIGNYRLKKKDLVLLANR